MADKIRVTEEGEAKCCQGRMWTTEVMGQATRHAEHAEDCKLAHPASAQIPVDPITRKRQAAKAGKER